MELSQQLDQYSGEISLYSLTALSVVYAALCYVAISEHASTRRLEELVLQDVAPTTNPSK